MVKQEQKKGLVKTAPSGAGEGSGANDIRSLIQSDAGKKQFALALPKHIKPDRFVRVALTAFTKNPKLLHCTQQSLLSALLDCSSMGIEPDGRKAHLIPYGDKCTLIVDYKGLVDIARRSGEIADIHADVVCEGDKFDYNFGTDSKLVHVPAIKGRGNVFAVYSFVRLKDGSSSFEVMNVEEIEKIHMRSKAANDGPWKTDWNEMAKKTVFRRHSKWLPVSSEFQNAIDKDYDTPPDISAGGFDAPMIGLKNDKNGAKRQPAIDVAGPGQDQQEPGEVFRPSPSDLTKTSATVMKREIMIMIRDTVGDDEKVVADALAAYTKHTENGVTVPGVRDVNDMLFTDEWVQKTHEKLASSYLSKIEGK